MVLRQTVPGQLWRLHNDSSKVVWGLNCLISGLYGGIHCYASSNRRGYAFQGERPVKYNPRVVFLDQVGCQWLNPVQLGTETLLELGRSCSAVEQVMAILKKLESDDYTGFMEHYYRRGLETFGSDWNYSDLLTILYTAARTLSPAHYLEIGVFRGRSMSVVGSTAPDCSLYGFDCWIENYATLENPGPDFVKGQLRRVGHRGTVTFSSGDSKTTVPHFLEANPDLFFDLITVDGDHGYEGARTDLMNVLPRLKIGGIVVFDDVVHPAFPWLEEVWKETVADDPNFVSKTFTEIGHGVSFAIRRAIDLEIKSDEIERKVGFLSVKASLRASEEQLSNLNRVLDARENELASIKPILAAREAELESVKAVLKAREEELVSIKKRLKFRG